MNICTTHINMWVCLFKLGLQTLANQSLLTTLTKLIQIVLTSLFRTLAARSMPSNRQAQSLSAGVLHDAPSVQTSISWHMMPWWLVISVGFFSLFDPSLFALSQKQRPELLPWCVVTPGRTTRKCWVSESLRALSALNSLNSKLRKSWCLLSSHTSKPCCERHAFMSSAASWQSTQQEVTGRRFATSSLFTKHLKQNTNQNTSQCPQCPS